MSNVDEMLSEQQLARILIFGESGVKKTWWGLKWAELGFNVALFDGDDGWTIVRNISPEGKKHITIASVVDTINRAIFQEFVANFLKGGRFIWDVEKKEKVISSSHLVEGKAYLEVALNKLTSNDVIIIDSWTALSMSTLMDWALTNKIDLSDPDEREDKKWNHYNFQQQVLNWVLTQLNALPCHLIVVGHKTTYEKYEGQGRDRKLIFSKEVVKSSSNPHSLLLPKSFSDVLDFTIQGKQFYISSERTEDSQGKTRNIKPGKYKWDELSPQAYCDAAGIKYGIETDMKGIVYHKGTLPAFTEGGIKLPTPASKPAETQAVPGTAPKAKITLATLANKKPSGE